MFTISSVSRRHMQTYLFATVLICAGAMTLSGFATEQTASTASPNSIRRDKLRPPKYPPQALRDKISGVVYLRVHFDAQGKVDDVQVDPASDTGKELLQRSAISAVKSWEFNPPTRDGRAVSGSAIVPFRYAIVGQSVPQFAQPGPQGSPDMPVLEPIELTAQRISH